MTQVICADFQPATLVLFHDPALADQATLSRTFGP